MRKKVKEHGVVGN